MLETHHNVLLCRLRNVDDTMMLIGAVHGRSKIRVTEDGKGAVGSNFGWRRLQRCETGLLNRPEEF